MWRPARKLRVALFFLEFPKRESHNERLLLVLSWMGARPAEQTCAPREKGTPMRILRLSSLLLMVCALWAVRPRSASAAPNPAPQSLTNDQFQVAYSDSGVTSLKRVNDKYPTDYIAAGRTLGDVTIRYRAAGEKEWKSASAAAMASGAAGAASDSVSYVIGTEEPTIAGTSRASESASAPGGRGGFGLLALRNSAAPENSHSMDAPRFAWTRRTGTLEWVEYDFAKAQTVQSAEVYWATAVRPNDPVKLPKSWRVLYKDGDNWKEVSATNGYPVAADQFSEATFSPVQTSALRIEAQLADGASAGMYAWRVNNQGRKVDPLQDLDATSTFTLHGDVLAWTISLHNDTDHPIEIGDLALPLKMDTQYSGNKDVTYTERVIPHTFIGGNGSFMFWERANGEGPYLVMAPQAGSGFEYFDSSRQERAYEAYIHSAAAAEELHARGGTWRLPNTSLTLAPKGQKGDAAAYAFHFRWATDYDGVRDALYQEGLIDVDVVPGMTVPTNLPVMFSLHTREKIGQIAAEHPEQTKVEYAGERGKDVRIYRVQFSRLGENMLKVNYGDGNYLALDFFVTQPLETLYKKRAAFMVDHEQWRDPSKWYNGLFSQWDMKDKILRSPDDLDGLQSYAVACDDPALGKAPYIAAKNVFYPSQKEIAAVEYYIKNYVWGGLQQTDKEPYPYGVYGIPNWKVNRDSPRDDASGKKHIWRIYDYPHVIMLYYEMYRVAKLYPNMVSYLDADGYLERAFGTAKALYTYPMEIRNWSPYETGTYNEVVIPGLIQALQKEGRADQATVLQANWEKKVEYFINGGPDLYQSEYPFDSTAFESTEAFATYAMQNVQQPGVADPPPTEFRQAVSYGNALAFLNEQMRLNVADRGNIEPAYYDLGSDYRAGGNTSYTLSYMSQMGGWGIVDYALHYAKDPIPYLRLGYASYLSSWALLNAGTPESNYGYFYPGEINDGGASGGYEPRPWGRAWLGNKEMGRGPWWYDGEIDLGFSGALRTAATIIVDDPIFGPYAYGGSLQRKKNVTEVVPRDGLRARFYIVRGSRRVGILPGRDGFAQDRAVTFTDSLSAISFMLENRSGDAHETSVTIAGLPAGTYKVTSGNRAAQSLEISDAQKDAQFSVQMGTSGTSVKITRTAAK